MIACVQRVTEAWVRVGADEVGRIGKGMLILLGVEKGDGEPEARWLAEKLATLRFFEDEAGKMNLAVGEVNGRALVVSQFTLAADCRKGRRPGFDRAAPPEEANALYGKFCAFLREAGVPVETGRFAAQMQVGLVNDGPVTFLVQRSPAAGGQP